MGALWILAGLALALLAIPAGIRSHRLFREGRPDLGSLEIGRLVLSLAGALALIAIGRSA